MKVDVYVGSSIRGLRRQDGVVGYVIETQTSKGPATLTVFGTVRDVTPNTAVLLAVKNALSRINPRSEVNFHLDNAYVAAALEKGWAYEWKKAGWKNSKGAEIVDFSEWDEILTLLGERRPHFIVGQPNEYNNYLKNETEKRKAKYEKTR